MAEDALPIIAARSRSPMKFFLLVFALSLPFWLAGALTSLQLLPALPISALMFVCPVVAAAIFVYREDGSTGVKELLKRAFDFKRVKAKVWYVPTILLMPCIMVLSYVALRLMGVPLPAPQFSIGTTTTRAERLRRDPLPRYDRPHLANVSDQRFVLRSTRDGPAHCDCGGCRGHRVGTTNTGSVQQYLIEKTNLSTSF